MKSRIIQDVEHLPHHAYGHRMTTWWGTLAFIALEGTGLAIAAAAYLYIAWLNPQWPLSAAPPDLFWSTSFTLLLVISVLPNAFAGRVARSEDKRKGQIFAVIMSIIGLAACVLRGYEFTTLNVRWDDNAYGSLLWFVLGLHTTHLVSDVVDTLVLTALMFSKHARGKRFSDIEDNAMFWNFVVAAWLPIYALLYWFPRLWGQG
jgi:cytochrome c oxidase subunit III